MGDAQSSSHGDIVSQAIGTTFLQTTRGARLHNRADIFRQLTDAGSNLARTDANDHTLGVLRCGCC